jgi:hypothetical protein
MAYSRAVRRRVVSFALLMLVVLCFANIQARIAMAGTGWKGQNSYLIPFYWCMVHGTPNLTSPYTAGANNPSEVILDRMARPTDAIFAPNAGILLRSAYAPWLTGGQFASGQFSLIPDPITKHVYSGPRNPVYENAGLEGDIYEPGPPFGTSGEIQQITNECISYSTFNSSNYGLIAIHLNRFIRSDGIYSDVIGAGSCTRNSTGQCAVPYDGRIYVTDNYWLHTSRPPNFFLFYYRFSDPVDLLVAHEVGHALGLEHNTTLANALMSPSLLDKDGDLIADSTALSTSEVNLMRQNARNIPGVQIDPDGKFEAGRFLATRSVDRFADVDTPGYLDLTTVGVVLDKSENVTYFDAELAGLIPQKLGIPLNVWFLIDADRKVAIDPGSLADRGVPDLGPAGMDVVAHISVMNNKVSAEVFHLVDGKLTLDKAGAELLTNTLELFYATPDAAGLKNNPDPVELNHVVRLMLPSTVARIIPATPFRAQVLVTEGRNTAVKDALDESGTSFQINDPAFAECVPRGDAVPGKALEIEVRKMLPSATVHGVLGGQTTFTGKIRKDGRGIFKVKIPPKTAPGYRNLSVVVDDAPITADCLINVVGASGKQ